MINLWAYSGWTAAGPWNPTAPNARVFEYVTETQRNPVWVKGRGGEKERKREIGRWYDVPTSSFPFFYEPSRGSFNLDIMFRLPISIASTRPLRLMAAGRVAPPPPSPSRPKSLIRSLRDLCTGFDDDLSENTYVCRTLAVDETVINICTLVEKLLHISDFILLQFGRRRKV